MIENRTCNLGRYKETRNILKKNTHVTITIASFRTYLGVRYPEGFAKSTDYDRD